MSRGNSIIAGVVLIGILGTLSIALQATAPVVERGANIAAAPGSRVAQVSMNPESQMAEVAKTGEKKEEAPLPVGCWKGHSFEVTQKGAETKVSCKRMNCKQKGSAEGETPEQRKRAGVIPSCEQELTKDTEGDKLCSAMECKVCVNLEQKDGTTKCVETRQINGDGDFIPKNLNQKSIADELYEKAKSGNADAAKQLASLPLDQTTTKGVLDAFDKPIENQERAVGEAQTNVDKCRETNCTLSEKTDAEKALAAEQKKLAELKAMQARLASAQTGETGCASGNCSTNSPSGVSSPRGTTPDGSGTNNSGRSGSGSTGFDAFMKGMAQGLMGTPQGQAQQVAQQNAQAYQQQCQPRYFCSNNTLYWGSPNSVTQNQYAGSSYDQYYGSYSNYTPVTSQCPSQVVQQCPQGCAQGGTQCAGAGTGGTPTANLECGDRTSYDTGEQVSLQFSCTNASSSSGSGFSTGGQLSGSTTVTIQKPPQGTDMVSYGLTCTGSSGQTHSDKCDFSINLTSIVIVANPKSVISGASTTLGWITKGMKECVISAVDAEENSPLADFDDENAENTSPAGTAVTPALTEDTEFALSCLTKNDRVREAFVKVRIKN